MLESQSIQNKEQLAENGHDENLVLDNPFPGLRPFTIEESHLFFGREGQSNEVLLKLAQNRFVAVVGPSGSGKSSFIFCGVIPVLYGGFLSEISSNWNVVITRPGANPIQNLANALLDKDREFEKLDGEDQHIKKIITSTILRSSSLGLVEYIQQSKNFNTRNTLILVDQFEELFRFRKTNTESTNESLAFVNLLMEAVKTEYAPIYVALTMRSDFIGDCAFYPELTESINNSYYMIPQMTRKQRFKTITGPILVGGGKITPRLTAQLLNDVGDNPDQLPILQHSLMRTWDYWTKNRTKEEQYIDIEHYKAIGTMVEALSMHANEAYDELDERQKEICERMFKTLTEKNGNLGIRRPTKLQEIASITKAPETEVIFVIDKFRQTGRSLLMPPIHIDLMPDTIIDISHESLMRIWNRLISWLEEEAEAVQMYLRLSEASAMYQVGQASLWRPPDLQLALNWQQKHKPNLIWAQRHNPAFERTMVFLEYSKKDFEAEQKIKEQRQKQALRRARVTALFLGSATVVSIGFLVYAITQQVEATRQKELAVEKSELAIKNEKEALTQTEKAIKSEKAAKEQKDLAEEQKIIAEQKTKEALEQTQIAEQKTKEALEQKLIAEKQTNEANRQKGIAEDKTKEAIRQENLANESAKKAEIAKNDAYRLRLLSIAQSMAVKSLQMSDERIKGLNAQQAYLFNKNNGGMTYHPDVYDGLYYAIKKLEENESEVEMQEYNALKGHTDNVRALTPSSTGNFIYSTGSDGQVIRWNLDNSLDRILNIGNTNYINRTLVASPNDQFLASGGDAKEVELFDLSKIGQEPKIIKGFSGEVWHLLFSSDSKELVASTSDNKVWVWVNEQLSKVAESSSKINSIATNPKGDIVAMATEKGEIVFIYRRTGNSQKIFFQNNEPMHSVAFSPNGRYLIGGDENGVVRVWDMVNQQLVTELEGHKAKINYIAFSRDNKQMGTASFDGTVRIWNMDNLNDAPIVLKDHNDWVWSIAFSADGTKLLAGCKDALIRIWPTNPDLMNYLICTKLESNMSQKEWKRYVAEDIPYENTCSGLKPKED